MNREQNLIWDYLRQHAVGMDNAIHINLLAEALSIPPNGTNNDNVRRWIKDMVRNFHQPIGTCLDGAFLFVTEDERELAAEFLERNSTANVIRGIEPYNP